MGQANCKIYGVAGTSTSSQINPTQTLTDGTSVWQIATIEVHAAVVDTPGKSLDGLQAGVAGVGFLRAIEDQAGEAAYPVDSSSYSAGEDRPYLISGVLQRDELGSVMQN